jgi:hypothetical protein
LHPQYEVYLEKVIDSCVRFVVFTAVGMMVMMFFFWILMPFRLVNSIFSPEDGDSMFLPNAGICLRVYTAPKTRTSSSPSR